MKLRRTNVLERVWAQRFAPQCDWGNSDRACGPCVYQNPPLPVTPHKITPAENMVNCRPLMRVDRRPLTWRDPRIQNAHSVILQQQSVLVRSRP